jgi:RNA polymerase sigma-70 factor (ECF subfamily)
VDDVNERRLGPIAASDAELLEKLVADPQALDDFYRRHVGMVIRFLARRCWTPEDVADATSATFLAVLVSSSTYDPTAGDAPRWLRSIAANEAKRIARGQQRTAALADRVRGRRLLTPDDAERISEMIDAEREAERLGSAIDGAPQSEKEVVSAMVDRDLSPSEAARALGISPGAARVRLSRLRDRLNRKPDRPAPAAQQSDSLQAVTSGHGLVPKESRV